MKIAYGWSIRGIRLYDTDLRFILDETWCTCSSRGDWYVFTIPDGQEICGLTCNIFYGQLKRVGFQVWTPRKNIT